MKSNLSIYFGTDRTYLALIESQPKGLCLKYINSTNHPIDLDNPENPNSKEGLDELFYLVEAIPEQYHFINLALPLELVLITQFPARPKISKDEILSIVNIEMRQVYPQFDPAQFPTYLFQLKERRNNAFYLAVIIPRKIYENIKKMTTKLNHLVEKIEISQVNSHNALLYNYPEFFSKNVGIFNIQDGFIDFSIINGKQFISYSLIRYNKSEEIPDLITKHIEGVRKEIDVSPEACFLFGISLTRDLFEFVASKISKHTSTVKKLNPLRMFTTSLSERERAYCSRIAHILPPCVGASIPVYHDRIKIY
jgi:hypothetical protein